MAKKPVKRDLVWEYIDENWPFAKKDSIVRDTGVSPQYAYMLLREYELIQKRTGNVHSSGRTEAKPVPTAPQKQQISAAPIGWTNDDETHQSEKVLVDASLVQHWESLIRESAEQARKGRTQEQIEAHLESKMQVLAGISDGSTASYYELPYPADELQDLISYKNMNSQIGEIFRAAYRYGESSHSDELRDAKKIRFYIEAEIKRLGG